MGGRAAAAQHAPRAAGQRPCSMHPMQEGAPGGGVPTVGRHGADRRDARSEGRSAVNGPRGPQARPRRSAGTPPPFMLP